MDSRTSSASLLLWQRQSSPRFHGLTDKMQHFAESVADGSSLADAYRKAFNTNNMKDRTIRDEASRLARNPRVAPVIASLRAQKEAENRMRWLSREDAIWDSLWRLIDNPMVPVRTKLKALELAARLCGMLHQNCRFTASSASQIEAELRNRLCLG